MVHIALTLQIPIRSTFPHADVIIAPVTEPVVFAFECPAMRCATSSMRPPFVR